MSVKNYTPDKCRYYIGKLENVVYLVSEEALKDIKIDNGSAYVASVNESPLSIKCYNLKLNEDESLDERYKFTHTVTFSVKGYMNKESFNGKYYVILKDVEGTYWLVNPLFPSKVTYTYTLGDMQNHTDFTLATVSNHPVLRLNEFTVTDSNECESYWFDGVDELRLNEKKYSAHIENHIKYTNPGGFKDVHFNDKTCVITETFDGEKVSHQIDFNILLSQYKNDWHYSLLEFKDNIYSAVFKTYNGKYGLCGFSMGMQPSFTINGESQTANNNIKITLVDAHTDGLTLDFYDSVDYEYLSAKTWVYTADFKGYECIGEGVARYLLMKEIDAFENETGNYKALEGYESMFPELNIVGTFTTSATFSNMECRSSDCTINTSFPSSIEFNRKECQTYYIEADSNWSITSSKNHITVTPSSGLANTSYTVNVCNTMTPTDSAETSTLVIEYCSTSSTVNVTVVEDPNACLPQGEEYYITAVEQTLTVPTRCCVESARETSQYNTVTTVYSGHLTIYVPENNSGIERTILILVLYCDGTSTNVIIHQGNVFEEWRNTNIRFCIGSDEYRHQIMYTGHTRQSMVETSEERDVMVKADSDYCKGLLYRWVDTGESGCTGCDCDNYKAQFFGNYREASNSPFSALLKPNPTNQEYECTGSTKVANSKVLKRSDIYRDDEGYSGYYTPTGICLNDRIEQVTNNAAYQGDTGALTSISHVAVKEIILPANLTSIEYPGMDFNSQIEQVVVPPGVNALPKYCFSFCNNLETVIVQSTNLQSIGYQCFNYSTKFKHLILYSTTVPTLGSDVFAHTSADLQIFVPASVLASYKIAPGWSDISNIIYSKD